MMYSHCQGSRLSRVYGCRGQNDGADNRVLVVLCTLDIGSPCEFPVDNVADKRPPCLLSGFSFNACRVEFRLGCAGISPAAGAVSAP